MEAIDEGRSSFHENIEVESSFNRRATVSFENDDRPNLDSLDHKQWGYFRLKQYFAGNHLDILFQKYIEKTNHGYLSTFLILLCVFSVTHFFIVLGLNMEANNSLQKVVPDLVVYISASVLSIIVFYVSERYVKKKPKLLDIISVGAFAILFFMNIFVPTFHYIKYKNTVPYRPAYSTLSVLSCYVFFNITSNIKAALLGVSMSTFYVVLGIVYNWKYVHKLPEGVACDVVYLLCINGFGIYFRLVTEIMKRISLLDRRVLVESTLRLEYEKEQGEQLMTSIIPKNAIEKLKMRAEQQIRSVKDEGECCPRNPWKFDVQQHTDVTILYADIVNYTRMTTTLKSVELVETLNELFGRFDDASEDLKVLRVKFLGDCYYCVAGLEPVRIPNHAEACVDLGLKMIKIIQDVKRTRSLPIDMRIGIHTGNIYSGVIGDCKWQFDIWSKDVSIANRMETTGQAGKVHVTKQTKDQLKKHYSITPSDAGQIDEILRQSNIEAFMISPGTEENHDEILMQSLRQNSVALENGKTNRPSSGDIYIQNETTRVQLSQRRDSRYIQNRRTSGNPALINGHIAGRRRTPRDFSRRTGFMDSNIKRYSERLKKTNKTIEKSIDDLSFTKYDQYLKTKQINPLTMTFKDCNKETKFIKQPDHIFKYYILGVILVLSSIVIIQNINRPDLNRPIGYTLLLVLILILPITWSNCSDYSHILPKLDSLLRRLRKFSEKIVHSILFRTIIYVVIWFASTGTVIYELLRCEYLDEITSNTKNVFRSILYLGKADDISNTADTCINPWHMTETIALAIIVNFAFLRIHMLLKFVSAASITILYSILLWRFDDEYFKPQLETYNFGLEPQVSHIIHLVFLSFALHCIDRQTDFMTRLDQMLNVEQVEKNKQAEVYQESNKELINNILPTHVATIYLNMDREAGTLYYEEYTASKPVAVMFAAIIFTSMQSMDETFLKCMNARIVDFDEILMQKYKNQIEKIKVANWTYMAACGLDPGKRDSSFGANMKATKRENIVVVKLLEFAAELLKHPHDSFVQFDLRIGISHGEVTAGVVGSKKPLYDIWGDAVNMASRMESTGVVGRIQVTENTANIVKRLGVACEPRGKVKVKGKDSEIFTYFIQVDSEGKLVKEK